MQMSNSFEKSNSLKHQITAKFVLVFPNKEIRDKFMCSLDVVYEYNFTLFLKNNCQILMSTKTLSKVILLV